MPAHHALIHEFDTDTPHRDDDGDPLCGFYYQFADKEGQPVSGLFGPYKYKAEVENAAQRAFNRRDF